MQCQAADDDDWICQPIESTGATTAPATAEQPRAPFVDPDEATLTRRP